MEVKSFFRIYLGLLTAIIITLFLIIFLSPVTTLTLESILVSTIAVLSVVGLYAILVDYSFSYMLSLLSLLFFPSLSYRFGLFKGYPDNGL